jgi:Leucine-rich repeat (LRR) protein
MQQSYCFANSSINELKLDSNTLLHFPDFTMDFRYQLVKLSLKDNYIGYINPHQLQSFNVLTHLQLENNKIAAFKNDIIGSLPALTSLILDKNPIRQVSPHSFNSSSLKAIHLMSTPLKLSEEHLDLFREATSLEALKLSGDSNKKNIKDHLVFERIFQNITTLRALYLTRISNLPNIPPHSFEGLPNLQKLVLDFNAIRYLSKEVFEGLKSLKYLSLQSNEIQIINQTSFPRDLLARIVQLMLSDNALDCSCNLFWFTSQDNR